MFAARLKLALLGGFRAETDAGAPVTLPSHKSQALLAYRLWLRQGRPAAARDLLAPVLARFTEGFATADLQTAQDVLDRLA